MKIVVSQGIEGTEIKLQENMIGTAIRVILVTLFFILLSIGAYSVGGIAMVVFIVVIFIIFILVIFSIRTPMKVRIDQATNRIIYKQGEININPQDALVLERRYIRTTRGTNSSSLQPMDDSSSQSIVFRVLYQPVQGEAIQLARKNMRDNVIEVQDFVEKIAKLIGVGIIDHTGINQIYQKAGETDIFVGQQIRNAGQGMQSEFPTSPKLQISYEGDSTLLQARPTVSTGIVIFRAIIGIAFLVGIGYMDRYFYSQYLELAPNASGRIFFFGVIIMVGLLFVFSLWKMIQHGNLNTGITTLSINRQETVTYHKGIFYRTMHERIPTQEIEKVIVVDQWQNFRVELRSDKKRVFLPGTFNQEICLQLQSAIVNLFAQYA